MRSFNIRLAQPSDIDDIYFIMDETEKGMKDKTWFFTGDTTKEVLEEHLQKKGFILVAEDLEGIAAFLQVRYPGRDEDNLGKDIRLPKKEWDKVVHMEMVAVIPECRGCRLQYKLMHKAEEILSVMHYRYYMATVHPKNIFCIANLKLLGYEVKDTKIKYDGIPRNIMLKIH